METIEGATREQVEEKIQAKISELIGNQLRTAVKFGGVNVTLNRKINVTTTSCEGRGLLGSSQAANEVQPAISELQDANAGRPINPSDSGSLWRLLVGLLAAAVMIYFLLHR